LDVDHVSARVLIVKMNPNGADAEILAVVARISRRERIVVQFLSADQDQLRAAESLVRGDRIRVVALPVGLT